MATKTAVKGKQTIGINMPEKMAADIKKRADSMHISTGKYCRIILQQWLDSKQKLSLEEQ